MNLNQYSIASAQPGLSVDNIRKLIIAVPTFPEQQAIGHFLRHETAKINALIEEQRRLIDLLKEKRQAVISHAVTKGLNPNTKRKSWKLKHLIKSIEQGWSPQCDNTTAEDGEWAVLKVGSVNYGIFNPKENKALPPDIQPIPSLGITKDDILISRANTRELVGSAAVAEHDYPRHLLCDKIYRLKIRANLCLAQYIGKFLGTPAVRAFIEATATGASQSMVNIGQDVIRELPISLPTLSEQRAVVAYLKTQEETFTTLTGEATRAVVLLQERRSALISAAVTGKIDVRSYTPKEAA
jgi:type I restriction enzyme S subunit